MKSWLVALAASVGLHVAAVGVAWSPPAKRAPVPVQARRTIPVTVFSSAITQPVPPGLSEPVEEQPAKRVARRAQKSAQVSADTAPQAESVAALTGETSSAGLSERVEDGPAGNPSSAESPGLSERVEDGRAGSPPGDDVVGGSANGPGGAGAEGLPLSPAGREGAPDVTALVHARLAAVADRCYPAAARRFQQRGTVQLSFCTDASGAAENTSVTQSSGAALLDGAARGCVVESASPFPREAASRCFAVPVRFGVR